jgi:hypothetical protein
MRKPAQVVATIIVWLVLLGIAAYRFSFFNFFRIVETDHRSDWATFYKAQVSRHFWIPPDAVILSAVEIREPIMGGGIRVRFRLPPSNSPEEGIKALLRGSAAQLKPFKVSEFRYDASNKITDSYWLKYLPDEKLYEACWQWD